MILKIIYRLVGATWLIVMLPGIAFAQTMYEAQVVDKVTDMPVPFATVGLVKARTATRTNEQGAFKLTAASVIDKDSLLVTCVGYQAYRMPVSAYKWGMIIAINPDATRLREVVVSNKKIKTKTLGAFQPDDLEQNASRGFDYFYPAPLQGAQMLAKVFKAPNANARVVALSLGRWQPDPVQGQTPGTNSKFRVHVMTVDPADGKPDSVLFSKDMHMQDRTRKVTINLDKDQVLLPGTDFFVVIEWLRIPYNEYILRAGFIRGVGPNTTQLNDGYDRVVYQPLMARRKLSSTQIYWQMQNGKWNIIKQANYELGLSATVNY